jgi:hypothetical protein
MQTHSRSNRLPNLRTSFRPTSSAGPASSRALSMPVRLRRRPSSVSGHIAGSCRELRSLSQRETADFCPNVTDALREADKPFWRG